MQRDFESLKQGPFDLLVVGGGIVGAWTAYDAALRGLKVAIVEKGDWAAGTSSNSSKLIHGGLRYLERFEFNLVNKSLEERRRLCVLGPHRVWPLRFGIPLYRGLRVGPIRFKIGLMLYDVLAGRKKIAQKHRTFSVDDFLAIMPSLRREGLRAGFTYGDAQTDDARFVLEVIDGALSTGAAALNYARVEHYLSEAGKVVGATIADEVSGESVELRAGVVVNASGVWSDDFDESGAMYRMTKGIHLLLPRLPEDRAMLLMAPEDGRVFFVIPWYNRTLVGTTDTDYTGHPDDVAVRDEDVRYLLDAVNSFLDRPPWTPADVVGSFAGLRMLQHNPDAPPSSVSRGWALREDDNGLLSSVGGKFTTAREDAAEIVDRVGEKLDRELPCPTLERPFPWATAEPFEAWLDARVAEAAELGLPEDIARSLGYRYGNKLPGLLDRIRGNASLAERLVDDLPFCRAEIDWAQSEEMCVRREDVLRRRVPLDILARDAADAVEVKL